MVIGDIGADQQNYVRLFDVLVGSRGAVAPEGKLITRDGAGHAQSGVTVVVVGAEAELDQLAQRIEFLGYELPGTQDPQRAGTVVSLYGSKPLDHGGQSFGPI